MTEQAGHALFETAIGRCGLAWNEAGVTAVSLPPASAARLRAKGEPAAPPAEIAAVIGDIVALLAGEPRDLTHVRLDMTGVTEFNRRALAAARTIPPGETATYGEIATRLGEPGAARAVGAAMGANPFPIIVPCHRVLGADGAIGGFSAPGGAATKIRMLAIERARVGREPDLFGDLPLAIKPAAAHR